MTTKQDALRMARETLENIHRCFEAARIEGLAEALAETSDEHLKDLVQRRLLHDAPDTALEAIAAIDAALAQAAPAITEQAPESIGDRYAHRLAVMLECALLDPNGTWNDAHKLLDEYRAEHERIHPSPPTFMGEPLIAINAPRPRQVDWLGLALDLEQQAKRVESQTAERAMIAGAHGLRLMGATLRSEQAPATAVPNSILENIELVLARLEQMHKDSIPGKWRILIEEAMPCALAIQRAAAPAQQVQVAQQKDAQAVAILYPDDDSMFGYSMMALDSHQHVIDLVGGFRVYAALPPAPPERKDADIGAIADVILKLIGKGVIDWINPGQSYEGEDDSGFNSNEEERDYLLQLIRAAIAASTQAREG